MSDSDDIIKYFNSFSDYEKFFVIKFLREKNNASTNDSDNINFDSIKEGWCETKTDIDDKMVATVCQRNEILDKIFLENTTSKQITSGQNISRQNISRQITSEQFTEYVNNLIKNPPNKWFQVRKSILKCLFEKIHDFSNVEIVCLHNIFEKIKQKK
jgi:hypothetical protein